ncbi:hypothetical protein F5Y08DRAFT_219216 [Xylaria arbuscula]|nr:hypothetical protein F5Y08DRAFT_219216 [Xylaria arbuscula]
MPSPDSRRRLAAEFLAAPSGPCTQSQQHVQSKPPSSATPTPRVTGLSPREVKARAGQAHDAHNPRACSQGKTGAPEQSSSSRRERTERIARASLIESRTRTRTLETVLNDRPRAFPALRAKDVLSSPRLQRVTGLLARKAERWPDRELPREEIYRLAWAMTLPEPFPVSRPRGDDRTHTARQVRKT